MDGRMFDGLATVFGTMFVLCVLFVPLGMWKLVELIVHLCHYVALHWH